MYHEVPHGCVGSSGGLDPKNVISIGYAHNVNYRDFLLWVSEFYKKPNVDPIVNRQTLLELYETYFEIHDHVSSTNPLSTIGLHEPLVDSYKDDLYSNRMREYINLKVKDYLGISFDEYMAKPRHEVMRIDAICSEHIKVKVKIESDEIRKSREQSEKDRIAAEKKEIKISKQK